MESNVESNIESNVEINLEELWRDERLGIMVGSKHEAHMIKEGTFLNKFRACLKDFLLGATKPDEYPLIVVKEDGYFTIHNVHYENVDFIITVIEIPNGVTKPISVTQEQLDSILNA